MSKPPVQPGERVTIEITGQSHSGDGIGRVDGFTLFVPQAIPGEIVEVQVVQVKKTYGKAHVKSWEKESPARVQPPCPIYDRCGGCQVQHLSYTAQLEMKREQVQDQFERIAKLSHVHIHPVKGMDNPWQYRNKAQVPVAKNKGKIVAGFYQAGTHHIIDMDQCLIQRPENDETVRMVKEIAQECGLSIYNEKTHQGLLRHIIVRTGVKTNEQMVILVTNGKELPQQAKVVRALQSRLPQVKSIVHNINQQKNNVIMGRENKLLWGEPYIQDMIGKVTFSISPHSFYQVNPEQTEVLYEQVRQYAQLSGTETVIDAYCGIGTIALYLAEHAGYVYGIESVPQAIEDAKKNASLNGVEHVHFEAGLAEEVMPQWQQQGITPEVVVVDPPRKGCAPELLDAIVEMNPDRLVYVSCNPSTLARDSRYLQEKGWLIQEVQPVDMFPQTSHVECVAWFKAPCRK
ncbi:23S rRNA (uracil(1939)-C(5))-methyltransferase RlmD [Mechercharimyces sp. CAU 1602]|uniref:23S rRNA (uracil(1939)-C(5))-methyltransferase RlmD n=1 Tax=Mechercharimyces sp. CAU 1602 TaxID=2973933 RepID=UPI0021631405|nr:23S rRNA (uracil(1939)-C(5))-methyltransferase RlmD [Mechercharimyces sp. CAU 1602]MCS1352042.1 23S rRNA (uracil(1939)-C(5))-methyltransferase RlmD [Mechercharimyces sp. CAU 1602]